MNIASVTLKKIGQPDKWVGLSLSLGDDLPDRHCSNIQNDFHCNIRGLSQAAAEYGSTQWGIGILSGARYAFGTLGIPHKSLVVHRLEGCLDEEDIVGISYASALCLFYILGSDSYQLKLNGWEICE